MTYTNYHSHFNLCDGKGQAFEYLERAVELGFSAYGFSAHAPLPFDNDWTMQQKDLNLYLSTIKDLKKEYGNRVQVYTGLEIDYVPNVMGASSGQFKDMPLDFRIGSVHMIPSQHAEIPLSLDGPIDEYLMLLEKEFGGSMEKFSAAYYKLLNEMMETQKFDILGHLDLIKKKNKNNKYFDESSMWYKKQILETLNLAAEKGVIIETNSGGVARGATKEIYPSSWIIKECRQRNIPMMVNADSHHPDNINFHFNESFAVLKENGYSEVRILLDNRWQDVPIQD